MNNIKDIKLSTVGKDDYEHLEGKLVTISYSGGEEVTGVVVGCNRSIGVTIVDVTDKDKYLLCFGGPVSPGGITECLKDDLKEFGKTYDEVFDIIIQMIESGSWEAGAFTRSITDGHGRDGCCSGGNCAYQQ